MEVLIHGTVYQPVKMCPLCNCVFEFEQSDVHEVTKDKHFIRCPECGFTMDVEIPER